MTNGGSDVDAINQWASMSSRNVSVSVSSSYTLQLPTPLEIGSCAHDPWASDHSAAATVPTPAFARFLGSTFLHSKAAGWDHFISDKWDGVQSYTLAGETKQIAVFTACHAQFVNKNATSSQYLHFPRLAEGEYHSNTALNALVSYKDAADTFRNRSGGEMNFPLLTWIDTPSTLSNTYSILATLSRLEPLDSRTDFLVVDSCTLQASWLPSKFDLIASTKGSAGSFGNSQLVIGDASFRLQAALINSTKAFCNPGIWSQPIVSIPALWANHWAELAVSRLSLGSWGPSIVAPEGPGPFITDGYPVASALSALIATSWPLKFIKAGLRSEEDGKWEGWPDFDPNANTTILGLRLVRVGTGYSPETTAVIVSMIVLSLYCLYVLYYLVYSAVSGISSDSWDSISEMVGLALNSKCPDFLGRTSSGLDTMAFFKESVSIRALRDEKLELVFENDIENKRLYKRVVLNKAY